MYIAIDFDGTCVTHDYPRIGKDIHAVNVLKRLVANGHKLILNTMRSGKELDDAVNWFNEHNIELFGVNKNPTQKSWTESPKVYAHMYIDDAAFGCPLLNVPELSDRPFVNWPWIELKLTQMEII
jgi:hydroxymethylpyrimidine pyrophosphatase-like HAD family hydrolase